MNCSRKCVFAKTLSGDTHIACSKKFAFVILSQHGIQNGWCTYPLNFDPIWVQCDSFTEKKETLETLLAMSLEILETKFARAILESKTFMQIKNPFLIFQKQKVVAAMTDINTMSHEVVNTEESKKLFFAKAIIELT